MLLVCLFSGITICDWRTNWHALPWGRLFLVLFVEGWSLLSFPLIHINMSIVVLFIAYQGSHVGETMGVAFDTFRRPISQQTLSSSGSWSLSTPLSAMFSELRVQSHTLLLLFLCHNNTPSVFMPKVFHYMLFFHPPLRSAPSLSYSSREIF